MRLYSYIVTHDTGFSPNPFWGYCTLANCKPAIRRTAHVGDYIVGLSSKSRGHKIIYAMQVTEVLPYAAYFHDSRFLAKIPDLERASRDGRLVYRCGDNIYEPLVAHPRSVDDFRQLRSMHSKDKGPQEDLVRKKRDLRGKNVLASRKFRYFGPKAIELPGRLRAMSVGIGHRCRFLADMVAEFIAFFESLPAGTVAPPNSWPQGDDSWKA
jgi:hypothetical protein